ncbi:MAG: hypothetical protein P8J27_10455, partial [Mariniblastus sp.]|nr:hypothetical protein [Mariniblastus sp.]
LGLIFCQALPTIVGANEGTPLIFALCHPAFSTQEEKGMSPDVILNDSEIASSTERELGGSANESQDLRGRLIAVGFGMGLMLALLGTLFGYLRLDHATRGFHSGRLQMSAIGVVALILLAGYFLWTQLLFK